MSPRSTRSPAAGWGSATAARAPTGRRPTARQSASFAPCSLAGPTVRSTAQAKNGQRRLTAGSGTTTIDADTQPSVTNPRSAGPTCSGLTTRPPSRSWVIRERWPRRASVIRRQCPYRHQTVLEPARVLRDLGHRVDAEVAAFLDLDDAARDMGRKPSAVRRRHEHVG